MREKDSHEIDYIYFMDFAINVLTDWRHEPKDSLNENEETKKI